MNTYILFKFVISIMRLILSQSDPKRDMLIIYSIPNLNISEEIQTQLRAVHNDFLDYYGTIKQSYIRKDIGAISFFYFEVPSAYYPEFAVPIVLTLYYEEHENTELFNPIIENAIKQLREIPDLSKAFYISIPHTSTDNYTTFGKMIKVLTDCFFEVVKKHETFNLGLAELLMLGTKGAGKSTVVDYLIHGKFIPQLAPTLTPKVFKIVYENLDFRVLDVCCKEHIQSVFEDHPLEPGKLPQAIIYVVDTTAPLQKQHESVEEFQYWMEYLRKQYPIGRYSNIPVLILFSKIDLNPNFDLIKAEKQYDTLKYGITARFGPMSIKTGEGVQDNFRWLVSHIKVASKY